MLNIHPIVVSAPVAGAGAVMPMRLRHRHVEDAERVGLADAQVDAERGRGDEPAVKARAGNRVRAVEEIVVHAFSPMWPLRWLNL